jgi:uncharacterized protein (TIGR00369 family)
MQSTDSERHVALADSEGNVELPDAERNAKLSNAERSVELSDAVLKRLRETFEAVPFAQLLGLELGKLERGAATIHLQLRDELLRNNGLLHGGVIASLADTAAAFAVNTMLEEGQITVTVDLTLQYLRPLTKGRVTAHAQVLRAGRRIANVQVNVHDEAGALAATMLTTYLKT